MVKTIVPIDYCEKTIGLKTKIEGSFLELGERLFNIRAQELWQCNWSSWDEFVSELKISTATASKLASVYERYILQYGMDEKQLALTSWSGLYELMPVATSKEKAEDFIQKAGVLRREELRDEIREARNGKCDHVEEFEVHIAQCRTCGARRQLEKSGL